MKSIVRVSSAEYTQTVAIGDGNFYLRGKMNEADGVVTALETLVDHEPTAADVSKIDAEAEAEWTRMEHDRILRVVDGLKKQLADTDYKVIKNSEWANAQAMANDGVIPSVNAEGWPYDPVALHQERQALRDEINEYEN